MQVSMGLGKGASCLCLGRACVCSVRLSSADQLRPAAQTAGTQGGVGTAQWCVLHLIETVVRATGWKGLGIRKRMHL